MVKKEINGMIMNLDVNDRGISKVLYNRGFREKAFMSIIDSTIQKGMVCLDLGANIGYATLLMAKKASKIGYVYAVEPDDRNFSILQKNMEENNFMKRCDLSKCIISDQNGTKEFWIADRPNLSSVQKTDHSQKSVSVKSFTLGKYLEDKQMPNFIKMDVEGHEVKILEGALEYFKKTGGYVNILMEVHPKFYNDENDLAGILRKYFEIGFNTTYVVSTPIYVPTLFKKHGYAPVQQFKTDGFHRGLYDKVANEDLIQFACYENEEEFIYRGTPRTAKKIVRSFMITRH